jgi:hypothetical protein
MLKQLLCWTQKYLMNRIFIVQLATICDLPVLLESCSHTYKIITFDYIAVP